MAPIMALHRFLLSVNCYAFLGKIMEWFPVAFSIVLEFNFPSLKLVATHLTKLESLVYSLIYSWGRRVEFIPFPGVFVWK